MISVGFYGQFQGPFICSLVLLGPMQRADGYICETWLFVNWRPPGGSGFCRHSATFAHDGPLPQSSLIRTQMDRFPWFDLVLSDQEGRLGRWNNVFQRRMFNWQFMLQKSSLRRCWESTAGIAGIPQCPFTPLKRCLITFGTHILWTWLLGREEKPQWCSQTGFSVLNSDTHSNWSWWAHYWGMAWKICYENPWFFWKLCAWYIVNLFVHSFFIHSFSACYVQDTSGCQEGFTEEWSFPWDAALLVGPCSGTQWHVLVHSRPSDPVRITVPDVVGGRKMKKWSLLKKDLRF